MGAFFLSRTGAQISTAEAKRVFSRKGLGAPNSVHLGGWTLLAYHKVLWTVQNTVADTEDNRVFCCGTVSYRGLGYKASLARLLTDYRASAVDRAQLIGNFCLLFWDGRTISLLTDRLNAQHLFADESCDCVSSSFLAVLAAVPGRRVLNRMAFHEKLCTGYIVGPDTLVEGIHHLNHTLWPWFEGKTGIRVLNGPPPDGRDEYHEAGFGRSVRCQLEVLRSYFRKLEPLDAESRAELGLSNGYDSRLLLALSQALPNPIPLHSHCTVGVHESELAVARELASVGGNELAVFPTTRLEELHEQRRQEIMLNNLYFFDARCINDMGAFSETYTAQYRVRVLGQNRLSLHGLGGEIYRNPYATPNYFRWNDWMDYAVFYPFAREACGGKNEFEAMRLHRNKKVGARLGVELPGKVGFHTARRYYGLVRMPDSASAVSNAYNQVAMILTPFIETTTLVEALKATPYIGPGGEYEAAMIRELSPPLAAVNSQYGHSFVSTPPRAALESRIKRALPVRLRAARRRRSSADSQRNPAIAGYRDLRSRSAYVREIEEVLKTAFPQSDWDMAMRDGMQMRTSLFIGSFLREFHYKLRF